MLFIRSDLNGKKKMNESGGGENWANEMVSTGWKTKEIGWKTEGTGWKTMGTGWKKEGIWVKDESNWV